MNATTAPKANDVSQFGALIGEPRHTTVRQHLRDEYGHKSLDAAAMAGDTGVIEAAAALLTHRGYDDPIIVQDNEDEFSVITHG